MALVYFDSSALVKLVVEETGSQLVADLWDGSDAALSNRLAYPEVRAALAAAARNHDLGDDDLRAAEEAWEDYWAATRPVELSPSVERHAGQLARDHALPGSAAVHLASALAIDDPALVVAVWNRRLHAGALASGVHVAPASMAADNTAGTATEQSLQSAEPRGAVRRSWRRSGTW
jgi:uncharacterized protein